MKMKVVSKDIRGGGKFLNWFWYYLNDGRIYEVYSRKKNPNPKECDAVDIAAFNGDRSKVCVIMEYRPAVEDTIMAFPAGLCEAGEGIYETAQRELWEECGLHMVSILKELQASYQSPGMSDESCATVFCVATGDITNAHNTDDEEIHPMWISKEEAREYLKSGQPISACCQMFLAMWSGYFD